MSLFDSIDNNQQAQPSTKNAELKTGLLPDILRPKTFEQFYGHADLMKDKGIIKLFLSSGKPRSMILWGPAGCGKTTLIRLLIQHYNYLHVEIKAMFSGVGELKTIFAKAQESVNTTGYPLLLFVDEIHRFNKAQQDSFLPVLEQGNIVLLGATTENPSFELNTALLSRLQVLRLEALEETDLENIIKRAEQHYKGVYKITKEQKHMIIHVANGDARYLLAMIESIYQTMSLHQCEEITNADLEKIIVKRLPVYDKNSDNHYGMISALHKSVRGSDVQASLYWFCRMLDAGEDPIYLARRLVRMAIEDIGVCDPQALIHAIAAKDAYILLGSPEGELALCNCVIYLATAPKSNTAYVAYKNAMRSAKDNADIPIPLSLVNSSTKMMKTMGYGKGYQYDHDFVYAFSGQDFLPEKIRDSVYFEPCDRGYEKEIDKRLQFWKKIKHKRRVNNDD